MVVETRRDMTTKKLCRGDGCDRPVYARGLCASHYARTLGGKDEDLSPLGKYGHDTERISLRLDASIVRRLMRTPACRGMTVAGAIERAVRLFLSHT